MDRFHFILTIPGILSHSITYNNSAKTTGTVKNGDKVKKLTYRNPILEHSDLNLYKN